MKIGLFIDTFYPMVDGVINVVDNYAKELLKYADVTVFCPLVDESEIADKPYRIVQCKSLSVKGIDYCLPTPAIDKEFKEELEKSNLDVVHIHSPFTVGIAGKNYAKKHKIPVVATLHSQYRQDFERTLKLKLPTNIALKEIMRVFNDCTECWTVNDEILNLYVNEYKLTAPCKVVQNATDHKPVLNVESACEKVNLQYGLNKDDNLYLFVGRINFLKNIELIVKSLKIVKERGQDFKMIFVGTGQDEEKLKELIKECQLEDRVILAGKVSDKRMLECLYARAKLFLFPSLYDANSLVQLEAACQKTPTLFVYGAKTASLVTENQNGFFANNDPLSYANEILRIESDPQLLSTVSENAFRQLYRSWESTVKEVYENYRTLCSEQKRKKFLKLYKKRNKFTPKFK